MSGGFMDAYKNALGKDEAAEKSKDEKDLERKLELAENALKEEQRKTEDYLNRLKYLQADFENYKKRVGNLNWAIAGLKKDLKDKEAAITAKDGEISRLQASEAATAALQAEALYKLGQVGGEPGVKSRTRPRVLGARRRRRLPRVTPPYRNPIGNSLTPLLSAVRWRCDPPIKPGHSRLCESTQPLEAYARRPGESSSFSLARLFLP
jgi:hypothetical protein